jgi:elongation factor G
MGATYEVVDIPEDMIDEVKEYRDIFLSRRLLIMMRIC